MKEIGEYLKNRRLELGISLEDAEQYLKIRKKYLIAIEEGDESVLPGRTYFVGYLRNYANYLEADQDYINQSLEKTEQIPKPRESEPVTKRNKPGRYFSPEKRKYRIKREKKSVNYFPLIKVAMIILFIGGIIFIVTQFLNRSEQPPIPVTQEEESENTLIEEKSIEQELTEMAEENIKEEEITTTSSENLLEPLPEYKPIIITTQDPAWVKIVQDGEVLFESVILSTEEITIKSEGTVFLLTNNSSDIGVFYDDQAIDAQSSDHYRIVQYQIIANNENN
jgi:cytoskeletal protein RodZ